MCSASPFLSLQHYRTVYKAKLHMFNPLFTETTVAENKLEVAALGLPGLAGSNAVPEWLLLEETK